MDLFTQTGLPELTKMMDVLAQRHRVIAQNVANAQTPGYKTQELNFDSVLQQIANVRDDAQTPEELQSRIDSISAQAFAEGGGSDTDGENDVDIESEMVKLSSNTLLFKTYAQMIQMQFSQVKEALK